MGLFLETERFPLDISYGSSFNHSYSNNIITVLGGDEYRSSNNPYVKLEYNVIYEFKLRSVMDKVVRLYDLAMGAFKGFRVRDLVDYTTNADGVTAPTALDQFLPLVNPTVPGVYQMTKWYGDPTDSFCARRRLRKPVTGTFLLANSGSIIDPADYTVDFTTGIVNTPPNKHGIIDMVVKGVTTGIVLSNPGEAGLEVGDFITLSAINGTIELNNVRAEITGTEPYEPPGGGLEFVADVIDFIVIEGVGVQIQVTGFGIPEVAIGDVITCENLVGPTNYNGVPLTLSLVQSGDIGGGEIAYVVAALFDAPAGDAPYVANTGEIYRGGAQTAYIININSTTYADYISGGFADTLPPTGFTFGVEFDIPCRFDEDFKGTFPDWEQLNVNGLSIVEILNP